MLFAWLEPLAPTAPEVSLKFPPPPDPLGPLASMVAILAVLLVAVAILRRLLRGRRGAETLFAFSVGLGNALMEVGAMLQPDRPKVTVSSEKDAPSASEDGSAGGTPPPPPAAGPSTYKSKAGTANATGRSRRRGVYDSRR
ncbi:MAG: hypothetical protein ACRBN8_40795 [Nannocystales bacterium]